MNLEEALQETIRKEVNRQIEEKLPEIIRALGIKEAEPEDDGLVDAVEVARYLKYDLSSPGNILKAKKRVYYLARINSIPSVRVSERNLRFDLAKVKEALAAKETQAA